jgi:threonine dehydrogenase-like Zn-dependent dehydrogenase
LGDRQASEGIAAADIVVEATGSSKAALAGFGMLAPLGVYAVIGASMPTGTNSFDNLVLNNHVVFGSVNASPDALRAGLEDLATFEKDVVDGLIHRVSFGAFEKSILAPPGEAVKLVHRVME